MDQNSTLNSFVFSVVIAAYNAEKTLLQAVDSLKNQTIGFDKIQIILVNDGSTDNTDIICQKLKSEFPDNIVYLSKEHGGPSSARNFGLSYVSGKYINFLDADDKWSSDAFENAYDFFLNNPDIKIATARIKYFGVKKGGHYLNYKFKENKEILDIAVNPSYPQLSAASTFFDASLFDKYHFNDNLLKSEGLVMITEMLFEHRRIGLLPKSVYHYYQPLTDDSAAYNTTENIINFTQCIAEAFANLLDLSAGISSEINQYVQYTICYDLLWRLYVMLPAELSEANSKAYKSAISALLDRIDIPVILDQRVFYFDRRMHALAYKMGIQPNEMYKHLHNLNGELAVSVNNMDYPVKINSTNNYAINIEFIDFTDTTVKFSGIIPVGRMNPDQISLKFTANSEEVDSAIYLSPKTGVAKSFGDVPPLLAFEAEIPLPRKDTFITSKLSYVETTSTVPSLKFGPFAPLNHNYPGTSYTIRNKLMLIAEKNGIRIHPHFIPFIEQRKREKAYLSEIRKSKEGKQVSKYRHPAIKNLRCRNMPELWLISDRITSGGDNGEAFFTYLCEHPVKNVDFYFVIDKKSPDYQRLSKIGPVLAHGSEEHKSAFMKATRVISSAAEVNVYNLFGLQGQYLKDLYYNKFVFLQHGITKDDISGWVNKRSKNISLFITAAMPEYDSIVNGEYGYTEKEVILSGFPRHDSLLNSSIQAEKTIYLMPTWRKNLANEYSVETGTRIPFDKFEDSVYFNEWNTLISSGQFVDLAKKYGYRIIFVPHPNIMCEIDKFTPDPYVIVDSNCVYREAFRKAAILVTDYSSVAFDVALLKKPILYLQTDRAEFFGGHSYTEGYFSYDDDGFGPVCETEEDLYRYCEELMLNGCTMPDLYESRIDRFFFQPDESRCKTIIDAIQKLK